MKNFKEIFFNCETMEQAKKAYRRLIRENHPDHGGSEEIMKQITSAWLEFSRHPIFKGAATQDPTADTAADGEKFAEIITAFTPYDVEIDIVGTWVWIHGDTKPIKEELKAHGFKWAAKKQAWYYGETKGRRSKMTLDEIKEKYGCKAYKGRPTPKIEKTTRKQPY